MGIPILTGALARLDRYAYAQLTSERMLTPGQAWGAGVSWRPLGSAGIDVTTEAAMQSALGACVRLLTDDISSLPVDVFRKVDRQSVASNRPSWLENPTGRRFETFQMHLSDVLVSLLTDGNAFIECTPDAVNPSEFRVIDPTYVTIKDDGPTSVYEVKTRGGTRPLTEANMVHIPWIRLPGKQRGLSVIEASKGSTGLELAARQWAGEFFANGATLGNVIQFPPGGKPSKEELELMRDALERQHNNRDKAWRIGILTGGAQFAPDLVLKPAEADLAPLWRHVMEEAARLYHIPPHMMASQEPGASSYNSVEHRSIEYVQHAVVPVTTRIERVYSRFLGRDRFIKLNVAALLRGDVKTRAEAWAFFLQHKVVTPKYVASVEDFPADGAIDGHFESPNNNGPREATGEPAPQGEPA